MISLRNLAMVPRSPAFFLGIVLACLKKSCVFLTIFVDPLEKCFEFLRQSTHFLKKSDEFLKSSFDFLNNSLGVRQILFIQLLLLLTTAKWALPAETLVRN